MRLSIVERRIVIVNAGVTMINRFGDGHFDGFSSLEVVSFAGFTFAALKEIQGERVHYKPPDTEDQSNVADCDEDAGGEDERWYAVENELTEAPERYFGQNE